MVLETAMAVMGAVQAAGGLLNYFTQKGFNDEQKAQFQQLYDQAQQIAPPELSTPDYEQYQEADPYQVSGYTPATSPYTAEGSLSIDEGARQKQLDVMDQLEQMYKQGGMDPQSVAAYAEAQNAANRNTQSQRDSVAALAQRQGRGGSNLDYLMQAQAGQDDANRLNQAGLRTAADARSRAMEAMGMFSSQASNLRSQDFGQNQAIAKAKDIYNNFNTNNMNDAIRYKTEQENQKAKALYANKQDVMDKNVGIQNAQKDFANKIAQQKYDNEIKKLGVVSGAYGDYSQAANQATNSMTKGIGDTASGLAGMFKSWGQQDLDLKSDYLKGGY
jgi:hypothetical protein